MKTPTNENERAAAIDAAALALVLSIIPADGYCPGEIGTAFADSIMKTIENNPQVEAEGVDTELGHECLEMILTRALARMNEHYNNRK